MLQGRKAAGGREETLEIPQRLVGDRPHLLSLEVLLRLGLREPAVSGRTKRTIDTFESFELEVEASDGKRSGLIRRGLENESAVLGTHQRKRKKK